MDNSHHSSKKHISFPVLHVFSGPQESKKNNFTENPEKWFVKFPMLLLVSFWRCLANCRTPEKLWTAFSLLAVTNRSCSCHCCNFFFLYTEFIQGVLVPAVTVVTSLWEVSETKVAICKIKQMSALFLWQSYAFPINNAFFMKQSIYFSRCLII